MFRTSPGRLLLKGNVQFVQNTTFGLWEKTIAQLRKMFRKIPMNTYAIISVMLVCRFVYAKTLLDFKGWLEKTRHRKAIVMDILHACNFIKKWLQHRWILQNFQEQLLCKTYANRWFSWLSEHLWCNKVLPHPCSIKD